MDETSSPPIIGVLDSGVGGLSVLREIQKACPGFPLHYVADSAWCPYGNKSNGAIRDRVLFITDRLIAGGASLVVIACNSATIHAVETLRATYPIPFIGMEPAVKPAAERTRTGVIGVLATEASIAGEKFHRLVHTHAGGVRVITQPCPRFVELVEAGQLEGPEVDLAIKQATAPLLQQDADVLVLGCTHYPFLRGAMEKLLPPTVQILDTGEAVARRVKALIAETPVRTPANAAPIEIQTSGEVNRLETILPKLLGGLSTGGIVIRPFA